MEGASTPRVTSTAPPKLLGRLLPQRRDQAAAGTILTFALGPILLLLVAWALSSTVSAQLAWVFRGTNAWPFPTTGLVEAPEPGDAANYYRTIDWHRISRDHARDPWGGPFYVDHPNDDDGTVFSPGPNGVFEFGEGDDVRVAGFFFVGPAHLLLLLIPLGLLCAALGAVIYTTVRQAFAPRSQRLHVELLRSALVALPLGCAGVLVAYGLSLNVVADEAALTLVSPQVALVATVFFLTYVTVLYLRMRKAEHGDGEPSP